VQIQLPEGEEKTQHRGQEVLIQLPAEEVLIQLPAEEVLIQLPEREGQIQPPVLEGQTRLRVRVVVTQLRALEEKTPLRVADQAVVEVVGVAEEVVAEEVVAEEVVAEEVVVVALQLPQRLPLKQLQNQKLLRFLLQICLSAKSEIWENISAHWLVIKKWSNRCTTPLWTKKPNRNLISSLSNSLLRILSGGMVRKRSHSNQFLVGSRQCLSLKKLTPLPGGRLLLFWRPVGHQKPDVGVPH
jgi:hypothetical protein